MTTEKVVFISKKCGWMVEESKSAVTLSKEIRVDKRFLGANRKEKISGRETIFSFDVSWKSALRGIRNFVASFDPDEYAFQECCKYSETPPTREIAVEAEQIRDNLSGLIWCLDRNAHPRGDCRTIVLAAEEAGFMVFLKEQGLCMDCNLDFDGETMTPRYFDPRYASLEKFNSKTEFIKELRMHAAILDGTEAIAAAGQVLESLRNTWKDSI